MRKIAFLLAVILMVIASCTKKSIPQKEAVIDSASVFSGNCARCHGSTGTNGRAPNLAKTDLDKNGLVDIITKGSGKMPEFQDKLSKQEIAAVSDFVLALKK